MRAAQLLVAWRITPPRRSTRARHRRGGRRRQRERGHPRDYTGAAAAVLAGEAIGAALSNGRRAVDYG